MMRSRSDSDRVRADHVPAVPLLMLMAAAVAALSGSGVAAALAAGALWNLAHVALTAPPRDRTARLSHTALGWARDVVVVSVRYLVIRTGHRGSPLAWPLLIPLGIFETHSTQWLADRYAGRPAERLTRHQCLKQVPIACTEALGLAVGFRVLPVAPGGASPAALVGCLWRAPLFDLGLDLGFYAFHRACHANRRLYRWVHAEHHTDVGVTHGRLVAHETYTLSAAEALCILGSYLVGLGMVSAVRPCSPFDLACLVSWAHSVELLGHTEMAWSPDGHPMRAVAEWCGLEIRAAEHSMHHRKPRCNFSKRLTLLDRLGGTYEPAAAVQEAAAPPPPAGLRAPRAGRAAAGGREEEESCRATPRGPAPVLARGVSTKLRCRFCIR